MYKLLLMIMSNACAHNIIEVLNSKTNYKIEYKNLIGIRYTMTDFIISIGSKFQFKD